MREHTTSCSIHAPRELVWDRLADYAALVRLCTPKGRASLRSGQAGLAGATYDASLSWEGLASEYTAVLAQAERPSVIVWVGTGTETTGSVRFDLAESGAGTDVTLSMSLSCRGAVRPLEPFAWVIMTRFEERFITELARADLERVAPGT